MKKVQTNKQNKTPITTTTTRGRKKKGKKTGSSKNRILGKFFATRLREKIYAVFLKKYFF